MGALCIIVLQVCPLGIRPRSASAGKTPEGVDGRAHCLLARGTPAAALGALQVPLEGIATDEPLAANFGRGKLPASQQRAYAVLGEAEELGQQRDAQKRGKVSHASRPSSKVSPASAARSSWIASRSSSGYESEGLASKSPGESCEGSEQSSSTDAFLALIA